MQTVQRNSFVEHEGGSRVRDTIDGRTRIAREIGRLKDWCQQTETAWLPVNLQGGLDSEVEG